MVKDKPTVGGASPETKSRKPRVVVVAFCAVEEVRTSSTQVERMSSILGVPLNERIGSDVAEVLSGLVKVSHPGITSAVYTNAAASVWDAADGKIRD